MSSALVLWWLDWLPTSLKRQMTIYGHLREAKPKNTGRKPSEKCTAGQATAKIFHNKRHCKNIILMNCFPYLQVYHFLINFTVPIYNCKKEMLSRTGDADKENDPYTPVAWSTPERTLLLSESRQRRPTKKKMLHFRFPPMKHRGVWSGWPTGSYLVSSPAKYGKQKSSPRLMPQKIQEDLFLRGPIPVILLSFAWFIFTITSAGLKPTSSRLVAPGSWQRRKNGR